MEATNKTHDFREDETVVKTQDMFPNYGKYKMKTIFICHPWRGNIIYPSRTKKICRDMALNTNDTPLSTGLFINQFLDDDKELEREIGINLGLRLLKMCDEVYVYEQYGISEGMAIELKMAKKLGIPVIKK